MRQASTVSLARSPRDDREIDIRAPRDCFGVGQAGDGIGRHDPDRLDLAAPDRLEQLDGLEARPGGDARRAPEAADPIDRRPAEIHVRASVLDSAPTSRPPIALGLAGDRKRPHARPADAAGQQMAVDQRIDLVDAALD
jgi:hypothetical protein